MRPVFAELVAEIQRSLGFYASTHREVELKRVLAIGNAFRLPGLQKYLENNLTVGEGVTKLEKFNQIVPSANINAPQFSENILSFGAAYGLALQGLGLSHISASLLPTELARIAVWKKKQPWFMAAAACLALGAVFPWTRQFMDSGALASDTDPNRTTANSIVAEAKRFNSDFSAAQADTGSKEERIKKMLALQQDYKLLIPRILSLVMNALPAPDDKLAAVKTGAELKQLVQSDKARYARNKRKTLLIENYQVEYFKDIDAFVASVGGDDTGVSQAAFGPSGGARGGGGTAAAGSDYVPETGEGGIGENSGFFVRITGRLLYGATELEAVGLITEEYFNNLKNLGGTPGLGFYVPDLDEKNERNRKQNLRLFYIRPYFDRKAPGMNEPPTAPGEVPAAYADPVTGEDVRKDWKVEIGFKIKLGVKPAPPPAEETGQQPQ